MCIFIYIHTSCINIGIMWYVLFGYLSLPTWYHVVTNGPIVCLLAACCFYLNTKSCPRQFKHVIPERVATTTYRVASHTWKTNVTKGICMKPCHPLCTKHSVIIPHQCVRGEYIFGFAGCLLQLLGLRFHLLQFHGHICSKTTHCGFPSNNSFGKVRLGTTVKAT